MSKVESSSVVIIPARYQSSRFPGKPLQEIAGKIMLERVWNIACQAVSPSQVYIATDDQRIIDAAKAFGAQAIMTPADCRNGSERVEAAVGELESKPGVVVNFQGDAVLTPPWVIKDLLSALEKTDADCATPAVKISSDEYQQFVKLRASGSSSGTFVVFDKQGKALYFSSCLIPYHREVGETSNTYRHIGIYAYRYQALQKYLSLEQGDLEQIEQLEQLRMLENGMSIQVAKVDLRGRTMVSVDSPDDVGRAEAIIAKEGDLFDSSLSNRKP